jgi:host factor-I protein
MAQVTEPRTASASPSQPNIQDVFLNYARREKMQVNVHLIDGRQFDARIKNFDRFAVIVEVDGADHLVFKHAIATIATQRSVANYFSSQHP